MARSIEHDLAALNLYQDLAAFHGRRFVQRRHRCSGHVAGHDVIREHSGQLCLVGEQSLQVGGRDLRERLISWCQHGERPWTP